MLGGGYATSSSSHMYRCMFSLAMYRARAEVGPALLKLWAYSCIPVTRQAAQKFGLLVLASAARPLCLKCFFRTHSRLFNSEF